MSDGRLSTVNKGFSDQSKEVRQNRHTSDYFQFSNTAAWLTKNMICLIDHFLNLLSNSGYLCHGTLDLIAV